MLGSDEPSASLTSRDAKTRLTLGLQLHPVKSLDTQYHNTILFVARLKIRKNDRIRESFAKK